MTTCLILHFARKFRSYGRESIVKLLSIDNVCVIRKIKDNIMNVIEANAFKNNRRISLIKAVSPILIIGCNCTHARPLPAKTVDRSSVRRWRSMWVRKDTVVSLDLTKNLTQWLCLFREGTTRCSQLVKAMTTGRTVAGSACTDVFNYSKWFFLQRCRHWRKGVDLHRSPGIWRRMVSLETYSRETLDAGHFLIAEQLLNYFRLASFIHRYVHVWRGVTGGPSMINDAYALADQRNTRASF